MNESLLTIVIPVYNTAMYLTRCIESVINQSISNLKIIVINDGSTDDSDKIIHRYIRKYSQIKYIKLEQNIGVGNARNIGIENATTKYIAFIDSDDWVDALYYENMLNTIERKKSDICISGIKTEVDDVYNWKYRYKYNTEFVTNADFCIDCLTRRYNNDITISPIVNNKIYKRSLILENNISFDKSRRAQDLFFSFMIFTFADMVSFCDQGFYHYYQRNSSATHNFNKQYIDDYFYILHTLKNELNVRNLYITYKKNYECYVIHYVTKLIHNMFNNIQSNNEQKQYIVYIFKKTINLISLDVLLESFDIERLKNFWHI